MKIFLSPKFEKKKIGLPQKTKNMMALLVSSWQSMTPDQFRESPKAKQLNGTEPLIYIVNIDNNRLFVSLVNEKNKDAGVVILDVQEKTANSDYLQFLEGETLFWEIDAIVADSIQNIVDTEDIVSLTANTNAYGWHVDDYSLDEIIKNDDGTISVMVYFHLSGDQDEDKVYHGTEINGQATFDIGLEGEVHYVIEKAEMEE